MELLNLIGLFLLNSAINILTFSVTIFVGWWIAKFTKKYLTTVLLKLSIDDAATSFICSVVKVVILIIAIIIAMGNLGLEMTTLIAALGTAGLTASFALQGSLSNFVSGMQLIFSKPFLKNDFIEVGSYSGMIKEITVLNTILLTVDNKEIIIPNSLMTSGAVVNYSSQESRRLDLKYSVSYGINTDIPVELIKGIIEKNEKILKDPEPMVVVGSHGDNSVEIIARAWVASSDYWPTYFYMQDIVKKEFDKNNIEIPFPQIVVHNNEK